mmetsp:Transcript_15766/g.40357  ORF Transcript_15766/g.40357 Transcript_15766/m.40357 type:complete len:112 (-) Transcript_15766:217-552(-)|eukprot:jgi/Tetstr1/449721/TSEL_036788.t1
MVVRIRLARYGVQNNPFFRIVAADSRSPAAGRHIEKLGHYNPTPESDGNVHVGLNLDRVRYWLSVGAQPSEPVAQLLGQAGITPRAPLRPRTSKAVDIAKGKNIRKNRAPK